MLKKILNFLAHPGTTIVAVLTGLITGLEQIGMQLQQAGWQLGPLAYMLPHSQGFFIKLTIASVACTFVAGLGKSLLGAFSKSKAS